MPQELRKFVSVSAFTHESADITAQNADISPNFLVWKYSENPQLPQSFGRFSVETLTKLWVLEIGLHYITVTLHYV